jgi:hypothetical protein
MTHSESVTVICPGPGVALIQAGLWVLGTGEPTAEPWLSLGREVASGRIEGDRVVQLLGAGPGVSTSVVCESLPGATGLRIRSWGPVYVQVDTPGGPRFPVSVTAFVDETVPEATMLTLAVPGATQFPDQPLPLGMAAAAGMIVDLVAHRDAVSNQASPGWTAGPSVHHSADSGGPVAVAPPPAAAPLTAAAASAWRELAVGGEQQSDLPPVQPPAVGSPREPTIEDELREYDRWFGSAQPSLSPTPPATAESMTERLSNKSAWPEPVASAQPVSASPTSLTPQVLPMAPPAPAAYRPDLPPSPGAPSALSPSGPGPSTPPSASIPSLIETVPPDILAGLDHVGARPLRAYDEPQQRMLAPDPPPAPPIPPMSPVSPPASMPTAPPVVPPPVVPISGLPAVGGPGPVGAMAAAPRPSSVTAALPDDGRTISRAALRAEQTPAAPTVAAVRCGQGHLSSAYAATCRVCRTPIPLPQQAFDTARPLLGQLVMPDRLVPLDGDLVLGRRPAPPIGHVGPVHLVTVNDPRQEVSSQHASITLDHWNVRLTDLGSTNGTEIVTIDGRRQRLVAHCATLIEPGTTIVLAEVVEFRFEATT